MDENTREFLKGLRNLMEKHGKGLGVDMTEGGTTYGFHVSDHETGEIDIVLAEYSPYLDIGDVDDVLEEFS